MTTLPDDDGAVREALRQVDDPEAGMTHQAACRRRGGFPC